MTASEVTSLIISLVSLSAALIAAYVAFKKLKPEARNLNADTAQKWQEMADKAADSLKRTQDQCDGLEERVNDLEEKLKNANDEVEQLRKALDKAQNDAAKYEHWAKMLSHQIVAQFDGKPVTLEWSEVKRKEQTAGR